MLKNISLMAGLLCPGLSQSTRADAPLTMAYGELSCNELYGMASQLEPKSQRFRSPLFNEKTHVIATSIGSVTTIGYYYFGFSVSREYYEDYRSLQHLQELGRLRQLRAQKYCFQKF